MDIARAVTSLGTVSIIQNAQYRGLRSCAGACLEKGDISPNDLVSYIGCAYPVYNTCFCNSAIIPQATSYISSCVSSACNEDADVPNAVSAWEGYCSAAGYPMDNVAQTTLGTASTTLVTGQATAKGTGAPTAAATGSGGNPPSTGTAIASSPDSSSQSASTTANSATQLGAIIGGAIGGAVVLGIVAVIITMLILRDRRKRLQQSLAQPQGHQHQGGQDQWHQPPPASSTPPILTDKILKTPAVTSTTPVRKAEENRQFDPAVTNNIPAWRAEENRQFEPAVTNNTPVWRAEENRRFEPELDGRDRMAPELQGWENNNQPRSNVPEMQGWGNDNRPRSNVPEMQA